MKDSAWYHKLWQNKLSDLPVKDDADAAWVGMKEILDKQLPTSVQPSANTPNATAASKSLGSTLSTYFGYIVTAAAMAGIGVYVAQHNPDQSKLKPVKDTISISIPLIDTVANRTEEFDSLASVSNVESAKALSIQEFSNNTFEHSNATVASDTITKQTEQSRQTATTLDQTSQTAEASPTKTSATSSAVTSTTSSTTTATDPATTSPVDISEPAKGVKRKRIKEKRSIETPPINYTLETGLDFTSKKTTFYIGTSAIYAIAPRWLISAGMRMSSPQTYVGKYNRNSYFRPDSLPSISFTDERKLLSVSLPILITYKLSNSLSLNAGPLINIPLKQYKIKLGKIEKVTDTLMNTKTVYGIINNTKVNRINLGISAGISLHFSQFDINTRYQILSPYTFRNEFGNNKFKNQSVQIGIGYRFK